MGLIKFILGSDSRRSVKKLNKLALKVEGNESFTFARLHFGNSSLVQADAAYYLPAALLSPVWTTKKRKRRISATLFTQPITNSVSTI